MPLLFRDTGSSNQRSMTTTDRGEVHFLPIGRQYLLVVLSWQSCFKKIGHRFSGDFFFKSFSFDPKNALKADPTIVSVPFSGLFV